jgi:hypothetical protein
MKRRGFGRAIRQGCKAMRHILNQIGCHVPGWRRTGSIAIRFIRCSNIDRSSVEKAHRLKYISSNLVGCMRPAYVPKAASTPEVHGMAGLASCQLSDGIEGKKNHLFEAQLATAGQLFPSSPSSVRRGARGVLKEQP